MLHRKKHIEEDSTYYSVHIATLQLAAKNRIPSPERTGVVMANMIDSCFRRKHPTHGGFVLKPYQIGGA